MSDMAKGEITDTSHDLLTLCQLAYEAGGRWFAQTMSRRAKDSYDRFYSRHPAGSKYHTAAFEKRSKIYRPKTRVAIRGIESQAAIAAFGTKEFVNVTPLDKKDKRNVQAAELQQNLLNSRLGGSTYSKTSIPWYRIYIGAVQEAAVQGVVLSKQMWEYSDYTEKTKVTHADFETGEQYENEETRDVVEIDRPVVDLIPLERFRLDPGADWSDPIGSAKFMIHEFPMYVGDIKKRMEAKGPRKWKQVDASSLAGRGGGTDSSQLDRSRNPDSQDKTELNDGLGDYAMVWVQEHLRSTRDGDIIVYTLDNKELLSDEIPLEELYPAGRPYVLGQMQIEAHRVYSSGLAEVSAQTQDEINNIANLRIDNLTLSMLGRYYFRRGGGVDIRTLLNGGPGSAVGMATLDSVKWDRPSDVTNSAYEEQDRLSNDFDDVAGVMSQSSIMSNKQLNETVGGMTLLTSTANATQEYMVRTITETWVTPVLQQLLELQAANESDVELLRQAAGAAGIPNSDDMAEAFELLQYRCIASPDVGFGASSPDKRIGRITMALETIAKYMPQALQSIDGAEVQKEIWGAVGHDSERFFPNEEDVDPRVKEMQAKVDELQKIIDTKQVEVDGRIKVAEVTQQGAIEREKLKHQAEAEYKKATLHLEERKTGIQEQLSTANTDAKRGELILQREALNKAILDTEREFALQLYTLGLMPDIGPAPLQDVVRGQAGPVPVDGKASPPDMAGDDKAGTLARDNYGDVPFGAQ